MAPRLAGGAATSSRRSRVALPRADLGLELVDGADDLHAQEILEIPRAVDRPVTNHQEQQDEQADHRAGEESANPSEDKLVLAALGKAGGPRPIEDAKNGGIRN